MKAQSNLPMEEVKYSLDWTPRTEVAQPPFYKRPTLFMLVCTAKKSNNGRL